jgi:hypothetical protein
MNCSLSECLFVTVLAVYVVLASEYVAFTALSDIQLCAYIVSADNFSGLAISSRDGLGQVGTSASELPIGPQHPSSRAMRSSLRASLPHSVSSMSTTTDLSYQSKQGCVPGRPGSTGRQDKLIYNCFLHVVSFMRSSSDGGTTIVL